MTDTTNAPTIAETVAAVKREILDGIADGTFPSTVATYSELHDYVDANELGGMCSDEFVERFGESDLADDEWPQWTAHVGQVQDIVDEWLRAGRPEPKAAKTVTRGDVILVNGEWVTVDSAERTLGTVGDVAITHSGRWTFYARPNASIPTRPKTA